MARREVPKVLVVDDAATHRRIAGELLARQGYRVVEACDGLQGISHAFWEMPDLIICDVHMPELSGYQVCRFLKHSEQTRAIPIILMTASELSRQDRFWGLRSGADRYVAKELARDRLPEEVAKLLSQAAGSGRDGARGEAAPRSTRDQSSIHRDVGFLFDKLLFETTIASEARRLASHVHDEEQCLAELAALAGDLTDFRCLGVHLDGPESSTLHLFVHRPLSAAQLACVGETVGQQARKPVGAEPGSIMIRPPPHELLGEGLTEHGFAAHCVFPLRIGAASVGSISLYFEQSGDLSARLREHLGLLAQEFAPVARLLLLYQENKRLSVSDGLTRLYNVRYLRERVVEAHATYQRHERIFSLLILDVDHFKRVNDRHGHGAGDEVLQSVAALFRAGLRREDVPARYGGDELVALLPETAAAGAVALGERLRQQVRKLVVPAGREQLRVTASIGVAEVWPGCADGWSVLGRADAALYEAKHAGRNAVRVFHSER
ncbi:MAG: diguanylate cyclase [Deltaproteobacteria bacterium]|nr:diguanylate cyclase [Deltaproteobacteria bacterium]